MSGIHTVAAMWHRHPGVRTGDQLTGAERFGEAVVNGMGSLRFLFWQTVVVTLWIAVNLTVVFLRWDPYPFILLNLAFSTQAAYAAPLILLGGKSSDRRNSEVALSALRADQENGALLRLLCERGGIPPEEIHDALTQAVLSIPVLPSGEPPDIAA